MNPIKNPSDLSYVHPILAGLTLALGFYLFSLGLKQRDQRVKKVPAPPGSLKRHSALGPWFTLLFVVSAVGGVGSAIVLRGFKPMATAHGWFGAIATLIFVVIWWLGRRLLAKQKQLANTHGLLGVAGVFLAALTALLGIELLP